MIGRCQLAVAAPLVAWLLSASCASPRRPPCRPFWTCIGPANPQPKIHLPPSPTTLRLVLAPAVADAFQVRRDPILRTEVTGWRGTLTRGFESGPGARFASPAAGAPADLVLEITAASVDLQTIEVAHQNVVLSARVDLTYSARLLDARGQELHATTASIRRLARWTHDPTPSVESAVAAMYEAIARECFVHLPR
ncbi:MAG: hypothetical protein EXR72_08370 [Myxococcales bacterium]|nr:hypothetical protein [Myxococcales bacterium]